MSIVSSDGNIIPPEFTYIYRLRSPDTNEIRYVGKSNDPEHRVIEHMSHCPHGKTHRDHWLKSLCERGLRPILEIIEKVLFADWQERETYWIDWHFQQGHLLVNTYRGSRGPGMVPQETRDKVSAKLIGVKKSQAHTAHIAASKLGTHLSPETIEKRSAKRRGVKQSAATIARKSAAFKDKKQNPVHVAKRIAAMKAAKRAKDASKMTPLFNMD